MWTILKSSPAQKSAPAQVDDYPTERKSPNMQQPPEGPEFAPESSIHPRVLWVGTQPPGLKPLPAHRRVHTLDVLAETLEHKVNAKNHPHGQEIRSTGFLQPICAESGLVQGALVTEFG